MNSKKKTPQIAQKNTTKCANEGRQGQAPATHEKIKNNTGGGKERCADSSGVAGTTAPDVRGTHVVVVGSMNSGGPRQRGEKAVNPKRLGGKKGCARKKTKRMRARAVGAPRPEEKVNSRWGKMPAGRGKALAGSSRGKGKRPIALQCRPRDGVGGPSRKTEG